VNPIRTGYGMGMASAVIAAAMLYFVFAGMLEKQRNPNPQVIGSISEAGVREITLQRNRLGHYVANGQINGKPVTFLLDTGATSVAIPADIAEQLNLERGPKAYVTTANGIADAYLTRLDRVSLGAIELENVAANITPGYKSNQVLLGMAFLKHLEFSQRGDTLTIKQYPGDY